MSRGRAECPVNFEHGGWVAVCSTRSGATRGYRASASLVRGYTRCPSLKDLKLNMFAWIAGAVILAQILISLALSIQFYQSDLPPCADTCESDSTTACLNTITLAVCVNDTKVNTLVVPVITL